MQRIGTAVPETAVPEIMQIMKFYDRNEELEALQEIEKLSAEYAQMSVITGRRRIGKTTLIKNAFTKIPFVYFFVGKKSESLLCAELTEIVRENLNEDLGDFTSFPRLFRTLMNLSKRINYTLVLDEFQNFRYVNESIFSDMQDIWDDTKDESHINLVVCGSSYLKMKKIFDDKDEPLYGRKTARFKIQPFSIATLKEILSDFNPNYTPDDLLTLYMITGGVAKYVEQLMTRGATTKIKMINAVVSLGSYFIEEGKELLVDELGKDYGNYFSVLASLASGKTTRGDITANCGFDSGGYLDRLDKDYDIVKRARPYLMGEQGKNVQYILEDNFLNFWFRFIFKYRSAVEIQNMAYVRDKILSDYDTYSGFVLEKYFRQLYRETGIYNNVTNYWESGQKNEIDLVAVDDNEKKIIIGEVKRKPDKIDLEYLKTKAGKILAHHKKWNVEFIGLSLKDM